jgi:hypothetical protein
MAPLTDLGDSLTQIATATGDENLAGNGVTHMRDGSSRVTGSRRSG